MGNIINPFYMIDPKTVLGNFKLLISQSIVSHNSVLGDNSVLSTALLCGHVTVGSGNSFGIHLTVIPEIVTGSQNIIQAGMIVDRKIGDSDSVFFLLL